MKGVQCAGRFRVFRRNKFRPWRELNLAQFLGGSSPLCAITSIKKYISYTSGFGGLGVACWPLVPKFAGSNPAKAVGFLRGEKNPQHAFLRRGSKAVGPMS